MKKRIASILLAVMMIVTLLPLGLVDTAWAAESSAITARVKEYIYACQSFKNANNASNVYWNALQCSTKGMSSAQRKQGMVTLKNHADQKNYQADLTTTPCKVPNNNTSLHNYSTNHHCDSNYFSGIDKGYGQCQGFTDYMAYVLFGEEGTKVSNFETIQTSTPYSFAYQPGDIVRVNGHSFLVYEGTGTGATIIECNMRGAEKSAFCVLRWNRTVKNDLDVLNTSGGARILRPKASLTVTGTQHTCNQGSFMYVWKAHPHYRCYRCSICGNVWTNTSEPTLVATCDSCRPGKPTLVNMQSSYASNQSVTFTWYGTANTTHYNLCLQRANNNGGWETVEYISYAESGLTRTLSTGNYRAQLISYNSNLRETDDSDWVHTQSDDCYFSVVIPEHTCDQGSYVYYQAAHPHYRCYRCSICGNDWANTSEPTLVATCDSCRPGKPALVNMQSSYASNQPVTFTWYGTANTTHYNLCLQRANNNGGWETVEYISYAESGLTRTLSTGNYRAQLISYNSNLRETDDSDWVHTQSDDCYFSVVIPEHTCDQGSFVYYQTAHPHYRCYRCSICGNVWANASEPTLVATCDSCRPGKPMLVNMQSSYASNQPVTFTWDSTSNTTHYNLCLQRANNNGGWETVEYISYAESGLTRTLSTGNYRAQLISYNSNLRETDDSDWVHTQSDDCYFSVVIPVPSAPMVKIGNSASSGKPQLTWDAVSGADSYNVYRAVSGEGAYTKINSTTATSYVNTGAKEGVTYYYKITAVNSSGEGEFSNIVSGQVKTMTQQKPSAPVVKIGNSSTSGKPMLTWNAVSGATSYKVYRATSRTGNYSLLGTVTTTSYTNTGAKINTTYYYRVKACNDAGLSAYSNVVSGQTTVTTLTLGHSSASGKPMLTWKAVSGAASYKVYRATTKNGAYSVINTTKALTYTNTGAALGTTYYYKVEALNAAGKSMGFSAVVEGKVAPVLAVGYSSVSGKPQLTWKAVPGATEYQVYRSIQQNSGYTKINTTTSTSYVNTGAKANTTYYYKIVAVKGTAASDFSNIVTARPSK